MRQIFEKEEILIANVVNYILNEWKESLYFVI